MSRPPLRIPTGLSWWQDAAGGPEWLASLPRLVGECAERWGLELGEPYEHSHASWVAPVRLADGTPAVLKLNVPDVESEAEPAVLAHWAGRGAVRLLAEHSASRALLVEACEPGDQLWSVADEERANSIAVSVLLRLWRPASRLPPCPHLADEAARWTEQLPARWERFGRPFERSLVDAAVAFLKEAGPAQGEAVLVHQDFHGGNVLRAAREPWLAIDPKPLLGEREFDTASLLRDRRESLVADPNPERRMRRRLDQLSSELALDRERMRCWGLAHALAWGFDERGVLPGHVACARFLARARD